MTQAAILAASGSPGTTTGFKNRLINGNMNIDQRNAGASVTALDTNLYTLDRWQAIAAVSSKYSVQQVALGGALPSFPYALKVLSSSAYSVGSSEYFFMRQRIEGYNIADLNWGTANAKTVTLSFWVYSSLTGSFGGAIRNNATDRSYPFSYTISAATTWEYKTVTIPGDTTGTWLTTNGVGMNVDFGLGVGATYQGTANTWAAANYLSPTGSVSVVGTNAATWYVSGVQLEVGTTATNFDFRSIGTELSLCQRYYEEMKGQVHTSYSNVASTQTRSTSVYFIVTKRANPTIVFTGSSEYIANTAGGVDFTPSASNITVSTFTTYGPNVSPGIFSLCYTANAKITVSAEL